MAKRKEPVDKFGYSFNNIEPGHFLVYHNDHVAGMDSLGAINEKKKGEFHAMHTGKCYGTAVTKELAAAILLEASKRNILPLI
jgi:hypothetical protein